MRRGIAGAGAAAIGAATSVTALVLGTTTGLAQTGVSSAYAVAAEGPVPIEPTPYVESTDGRTQTDSAVSVPLGEYGSVNVGEVMAGNNTASVTLTDVSVAHEGTGSLRIEALKIECTGDQSALEIANITANGEPHAVPGPVEMETIDLQQLGNVTFHQQVSNADGYTANGVVINLLPGTDAEQTITLASVTCGGPADDGGAADNGGADGGADGDKGDGGDGPTATKPAPITTGLPVTG